MGRGCLKTDSFSAPCSVACTNELGLRENRYLSYKVKGGVARGSHTCKILQAGRGQEEPGSIMRVKLVIGSCHKQKSSNCPHQSKIKGFNNQWDLKKKKKPINLNLT